MSGGIDFERVEGAEGPAAPGRCEACGGELGETYWTVNGRVACADCRQSVAAFGQGGSPAARFFAALALGAAGGAAGAVVWYLVLHITGWQAGIVAILVGFLVGGGVRMGAQRTGGWVYQLLAIVLSYLAIAASWLPEVLRQLAADGEPASIPVAVVIAFMVPATNSVMGAIITAIALWEAWRMNKRPEFAVTGPHRLRPSTPPPLPPVPLG